jgi:glycosyl transferase, family 25
MQPTIFVINMKQQTDRMESVAAQLHAQGLKFERFEAINGRALSDGEVAESYSDWWYRLFHGMAATKGNLGCSLSHRKIQQYIVGRNLPWAIILEDDIVLAPNFAKMLGEIERATREFDMMQLFSFRAPSRKVSLSKSGAFEVMTYQNLHSSTAAYAMRLTGARKMLTVAKIRTMPDRWCWMSAMTGLKCCAIWPYPITLHEELAANSSIGNLDAGTQNYVPDWKGRFSFWRILVLPWLNLIKVGILRVRGL